ncbi:MAG: cation diffusion facilitator family transporter [Myxococcales bacterium]
MDTTRRKARAASISVFSNASLVAGKLVIGLLTGSVSVISEAIHSAVDLVAAGIALFAVKTATKPADKDHAYGHGKIENVSGTVEAILIFLAAAWIVYEAIHKLLHKTPVEMPGLGVAVMAASSVANYLVSRMLFRVGKETDSIALQADAWHLRTDVWTSAGVMCGLLVIMLTRWLLPAVDLWWLDPVAAMAVALLIVKAAWDLTRESLKDVMDESLPEDEQRWIVEHVSTAAGVLGFHGLRTRKSGPQRFVDFHLLVDRSMSVETSHRLAHDVSGAIKARFEGASVTIHVEPCDGRCKPSCLEGCLLTAADRDARHKKSA